jgi:ribosome biogenesis GTPase
MTEFHFDSLRRVGLTPAALNAIVPLLDESGATALMRVSEVHRDACVVHDGEREQRARALPGLAAGDWVEVVHDATEGVPRVVRRLAPFNEIARRGSDGHRQVLASNVDTALLVMGLDLDFNPRRAERYVALVRACGVEPVLVLTKADIGHQVEQRVFDLRRRLPATVPSVAVNGASPQARVELAPWLASGRTLVLLGASGAGKSTLTNTLTQHASSQDTGGVRRGDGRGMHTTTSRSLHLCPDGACIIDTPGLRTWRPDADSQSLAAAFDDIAVMAAACRFRDCTHSGEPGCAVRDQVSEDRIANYRKLLREADRAEQTPLDRIQERNRWKVLHRAGKARSAAKRG